jgi:cytosine deaminase
VRVAAASGNIQDPFIPTGSGDPLEVALDAARRSPRACRPSLSLRQVTSQPASILGLGSSWGIHEGARADLLITDADDPEDLVATGSLKRTVLVGGRVVAGVL